MTAANTSVKGQVVPFGKYKGEPVEVLLADQGYRDWLMAQSWFRDKFTNVYQTIINYGSEPQETPEHNEMQASFLDDGRCLRLASLLHSNWKFDRKAAEQSFHEDSRAVGFVRQFHEITRLRFIDEAVADRAFEVSGWDVVYSVVPAILRVTLATTPGCVCECDHETDCPGEAVCHDDEGLGYLCSHRSHKDRLIPTPEWVKTAHQTELWKQFPDQDYYVSGSGGMFEKHCVPECAWSDKVRANWLVYRHDFSVAGRRSVRVELKPDLGDDFPTVLRQVKRYPVDPTLERCCVVVRRAQFEKVTWEQVSEMFASSGIQLIRESDLEAEAS